MEQMNNYIYLKTKYSVMDFLSTVGVTTPELRGKSIKVCCPFHNEKTPSFTIYIESNTMKCFGCGFGGDMFSYIEKAYDLKGFDVIKKAYELFKEPLGLSKEDYKEKDAILSLYNKYVAYYVEKNKLIAISEAEKLGFSKASVSSNNIFYVKKGDKFPIEKEDIEIGIKAGLYYMGERFDQPSLIEHFSVDDRLVFPIITNDYITYMSGRNQFSDKKYKNLIVSKSLMGYIKGSNCTMFEGVTDYIFANDQKINCVAIPGHIDESTIVIPSTLKSIDLFLDGDAAGDTYILKYGVYFAKKGVSVSVYLVDAKTDYRDLVRSGKSLSDVSKLKLYEYIIKKHGDSKLDSFYASIRSLRAVDRNKAFKAASKVLNVSVESVTEDYRSYCENNKEAGVINGFSVPDGYRVSANGVYQLMHGRYIKIYPSYLVVDSVGVDSESGVEYVKLCYFKGKKKRHTVITKESAYNHRDLLKLSSIGLDISSTTAQYVSNYIMWFCSCNLDVYENRTIRIISKLGWNDSEFITPSKIYTKDGLVSNTHYVNKSISASLYNSKGTLSNWVSSIKTLNGHNIPIFTLYVSLSSVLIKLIGSKNIILHLYSDSTRGKTTCAMIGASAYGNPHDKSGIIYKYNATHIGLQRLPMLLRNLPVFLDELSTQLGSSEIAKLMKYVYQFSEGKTRLKAMRDSAFDVDQVYTHDNCLISTGEIAMIMPGTTLTGSKVRTLQLTSEPFPDCKPYIDELTKSMLNNYGHALEPFLSYLNENMNFDEYGHFIDTSSLSPVGARIAEIIKPAYIAGCMCEKVFNFGFDPKQIVCDIYNDYIADIKDTVDIVDVVIAAVVDFYTTNMFNFISLEQLRTDAEKYMSGDDEKSTIDPKSLYQMKGVRDGCNLALTNDSFRNVLESTFGSIQNETSVKKSLQKSGKIKTESGKLRYRVRVKVRGVETKLPCVYFLGILDDDSLTGNIDRDKLDDKDLLSIDPF